MRLLLIVGSRGSGKTSLCEKICRAARTRQLFCCGCLEVSERSEDGRPYRVELVDLAGGDALLAARRKIASSQPFEFFHESFALIRQRCITALRHSSDTAFSRRICILDEIGPLELNDRQGHAELLECMLHESALDALVLTVRPSLAKAVEKLIFAHGITAENYRKLSFDGVTDIKSRDAIISILDSIFL